MQKTIADAVAAGNYLNVAAQYAGLPPDTVYQWIHRGRAAIERGQRATKYAKFVIAIDQAMAAAEMNHVEIIESASGRSWAAAAWWLERRYPGRWGKKPRVLEEAQERGDLSDLIDQAMERRAQKKKEEAEKRAAEESEGLDGSLTDTESGDDILADADGSTVN